MNNTATNIQVLVFNECRFLFIYLRYKPKSKSAELHGDYAQFFEELPNYFLK